MSEQRQRNIRQITRQWMILRLLEQSRRGRSVPDLHGDLGGSCSERTLYRDVEALQEAGFPLREDEGRWSLLGTAEGGWVVPLMPTELLAVALTEGLLVPMGASTLLGPLHQLRQKLMTMLPPKGRAYFQRLRRASQATVRAPVAYGEHAEILTLVQEAVCDHRVLRIVYQKPGGEPTARDVEPYVQWVTSGSFYLVAWCRRAEAFRQFAIQRIQSAESTGELFRPDPDFDPARHVRRGFGAYLGESYDFVIRFSAEVAHIPRERRHHASQRVRDLPDGGVELTMHAAGLPEVAAWVASFGGLAWPVAPQVLVDRVAALHRAGLARLVAADG